MLKTGLLAVLQEIFKRALVHPGPPESFALQTVQEAINPQACAVQSGEPIMQYGQSIADGAIKQGQIPRLLARTVCSRKIGDVEDMQSASSSSIKAVNIKGVFNTSNETKYEKEAPDGISIDFNFYKTFWSLQIFSNFVTLIFIWIQEYFYSPPSLTLNPTKWHRFTSSLAIVLNTFEAQPLSDEEGNANNFEEEGASFNIKYLTSSKLMGLELKDPSFRHHVLVQCLILFDYLKAPGKSDKDLPSEAMVSTIP
ncbi:hypothetical protein Cgig2_026757 [Carnegiea gigantea]|uniref:Uncharacterized protein n=1 Tax=Carnegiea gigantea TaxID=171969 RepID=A0A9Q1Q7N0_9CARY|nr:hypothetical protein Cgig2_026757 [Carnegiea gigantea]